MNSRSDLERALDDFFRVGSDEVADRVIDAALLTIDHTPQRRAMGGPWRSNAMSTSLKLATIAAAVVLAAGGAALMLGRMPGAGVGGVGSPAHSIAPSASVPSTSEVTASPTSSLTPIDTSGWKPYTSTRYGYTIAHPPTMSVGPATEDWTLEDRLDWMGFGVADRFLGSAFLVTAFAADVPNDMSENEWVSAYSEGLETDGGGQPCDGTYEELPSISVDGHAGRLRVNDPCDLAQAFVFIDGRVHVFAVWRPNQEALLQAMVSTVAFQR